MTSEATKTRKYREDRRQAKEQIRHEMEQMAPNGKPSPAPESEVAQPKPIILPDLDIRHLTVRVVGDASLICHNWDKKAEAYLGPGRSKPTAGREIRDEDEEYRLSLYYLPDGRYGFPALAFKNAAVTACTSLGKKVTKVQARQAFHMVGDLLPIESKSGPQKRTDTVRYNKQSTDMRYRGEFLDWSIELLIRYNARVFSPEQIINLINISGFAVGIGEWRPERNGIHGLFHVE